MGYRDNIIGSLIIIILLMVLLNRFVFSADDILPIADDVKVDQVFTDLKFNDEKTASATFTMANPEILALPEDRLKISFNEVCGHVKNYYLYEITTCSKEVPIYSDRETCEIILNKTTDKEENICTTERIIERTETTYYDCEKKIDYIDGTKDYKIKADIQIAKCSDGSYGYKIDWLPTLTTDKEIITQEKWAWWNTTYAWRKQINCSNIATQIPVVVNGSNGFTLNGTKMFIHTTNCNSTSNTYIYYNNNLSYTIADDVGMVAWDNPSDFPRISYQNNGKAVYGSSAQSIYHLGDGNDSSYFGNNLTNNGMDYVTGLIGKAIDSENGEADDMGRNPYVTNISRAYTILAWLKPESVVNGGYWLMTYNGEATFLLRERCILPGGVYFESTNSSGAYAFNNFNHTKGGLSMSVGTWQLYAVTYDGTTGKAWYNTTISDTSTTASQDNFNPTTIRIGYFTGASNSFDGLIDELMIFNESWSDNQIGYYYNNTHPAGVIIGYGSLEDEETQTTTNISFNSQTPPDLNTTSLLYNSLNITYNYTSISDFVNNTIVLYYKTNNSVNDYWEIINGTIQYNNYTTRTSSKQDGDVVSFIIGDNIYPSSENIGNDWLRNSTAKKFVVNTTNQYLKQSLLNISTNKQNSFIEVMSNSTASYNILVCNNSYLTGNPLTSSYCSNAYTSTANQAYDHVHSTNSQHIIIPFAFNTTIGTFNGIGFNDGIMYLLIEGNTAGVNVFERDNVTRKDSTRYSGNGGSTWNTIDISIDFHVHQYDGTENFTYYACGNLTIGGIMCEGTRTDNLQAGDIPPNSPEVFKPINTTYLLANNTLLIEYTPSISPSGKTISGYNITLYNGSNLFDSIINSNNTNLYYSWDYSNKTAGSYKIRVTAKDTDGLEGTGESPYFAIRYCTENWTSHYTTCNVSDKQLIYYTDNANCNTFFDLPTDNNTNNDCNYCVEDIHVQSTGCVGGFETTNYTDSNFFLCCYLTGIISDCSIIYSPYNTTTRTECNVTTTDPSPATCNVTTNNFTCNYDYQPLMHEKMNIVCEMPDQDDYRCVANIYQLNILLQTNPEYREASDSLFNFKGEGDTREFFTPENRLLNAFYTPKNMRTDKDFMIQILCTSNNKTIKSEYCITPEYESMGWVNNRLIWIKDNIIYVIIFLFIIIAIIGSLIYYAKQSSRGY